MSDEPQAWDAEIREFLATTSFDHPPTAAEVAAFIDGDTATDDE